MVLINEIETRGTTIEIVNITRDARIDQFMLSYNNCDQSVRIREQIE